jgi:plasmid segregation protein ParM
MLIAIDHGNKQMKTVHKVFASALTESDTRPPFGDDILEYGGKFYSLSGSRIPYLRDKTIDGRFFILSLFAIAYEIEAAGAYSPDEIMDVQLAVGLPPAHWGTQASKFEGYFLGKDILSFTFKGKPHDIYISEAVCFPQAYAAIIPIYNRLREMPKAVVVDIGGYTVDYMPLKHGKEDTSAYDSLENGVIFLYNSVKSKVNADLDLLLEDSDIDLILNGSTGDFDEAVMLLVKRRAQSFVDDLVGQLRERMIDLRVGKTVFVGGGSILLRRQIEACDKIGSAVFVDEITANARGYEVLYRASRARR